MSNPHCGHRNRLREKFLNFGRECLSEHELLELLLYSSIPRKNTNGIAHDLIEKFGSLRGVLSAEMDDLVTVPGVGPNCAFNIKLATEIGRHYFLTESNLKRFASVGEASEYIVNLLFEKREEHFYIFCLDMNLKLAGQQLLFKGSLDQVSVNIREIVQIALRYNAAYVILAHNHPSGSPNPSRADIHVTSEIMHALDPIGVKMVDHIITSGRSFYSFRQQETFSFSNSNDRETTYAAQYTDLSED
jgi:DNA repair protein RadC